MMFSDVFVPNFQVTNDRSHKWGTRKTDTRKSHFYMSVKSKDGQLK